MCNAATTMFIKLRDLIKSTVYLTCGNASKSFQLKSRILSFAECATRITLSFKKYFKTRFKFF